MLDNPPVRIPWAQWFCAACLSLLVFGCGGQTRLEKKVLQCAQLQGAKTSELTALAEEVSRIERAGEGPRQLTRPAAAKDQNAASLLAEALDDSLRLRLFPDLESLAIPSGEEASPEELAAMRSLLAEHDDLFAACVKAVEAPRCESYARFDLGFFERYPLLDDAAIAARMHLIAAYVAQADDDRTRLFEETRRAAQWTRWLAREPRLEGRLLAARLRQEWFALLSHVTARQTSLEELTSLFSMLRSQLSDWPSDRASLVGDRALTLHAYEAIRLGMISRVITLSEREALKAEGWLEKIQTLDAASLDQDELLYLQAMDKVIQTSTEPYFKRAAELSPLFGELEEDGELTQQAPVASRLFLVGVAESLELMARDRALTEAWALAIASAANFDLPPYRVNPLNGRPYEADRTADGVRLLLGDYETSDPYVNTPEVLRGKPSF